MPLQYIEGRCDVCGDEIGNHEPFAITNLGLIVCKACGDKNQDMIFKWFDTTQTALDLIVEEHGTTEEPEGEGDVSLASNHGVSLEVVSNQTGTDPSTLMQLYEGPEAPEEPEGEGDPETHEEPEAVDDPQPQEDKPAEEENDVQEA